MSKPLQPRRRVKKLLWNLGGVVIKRNDYTRVSGTTEEAYNVLWDADGDEPSKGEVRCWRAHLRPESRLSFFLRNLIP